MGMRLEHFQELPANVVKATFLRTLNFRYIKMISIYRNLFLFEKVQLFLKKIMIWFEQSSTKKSDCRIAAFFFLKFTHILGA